MFAFQVDSLAGPHRCAGAHGRFVALLCAKEEHDIRRSALHEHSRRAAHTKTCYVIDIMPLLPPTSEMPTPMLPDFNPKKAWVEARLRLKLARDEERRTQEARRLMDLIDSTED